jgi:RNA polymerase sigma-70 factor (ECF subfamily)
MGQVGVVLAREPQSLVSRYAEGDDSAFDEIVSIYGRDVYRVARRMTNSADDADDAVQETFVRACQRLHSVDCDANLRRWLLTITINYCIDRRRRRRVTVVELSSDTPSHGRGPEHSLLNRELAERLEKALTVLSGRQRACFVLHETEGLKVAEIAVVVGCSVGAVKCYLHRARGRLRRELSPYVQCA